MRIARLLAAAVLATACAGGPSGPAADPPTPQPSPDTAAPTLPVPSPTSPPTTAPPPAGATSDRAPSPTGSTTTEVEDPGTPVHLHVESRATGITNAAFRSEVADILADPRGWTRAGFTFPSDGPDPAPYTLVLAEPDEVDELCLPLDTEGTWSCQNGPVVALNADRWRTATPTWQGSLADYRRMLLNHEVGHLLHLHHPVPQCPALDLPAPVMAQQSSGAAPCRENPWPLQWEVDLAAEQREPLAPPANHDTRDHQPSPPPATE